MAPARTIRNRGGPGSGIGAVLSRLVAALQHVAIGMAVVGPDGQVVAINRAFGRMLGLERDDPLPDDVLAIVGPAERADDAAAWSLLASGSAASYEREQRFAHKDGKIRWGSVTISALRDDAGGFSGALAHIQDITAQKAAEASIRENEARLTALVEQLPVALYRQEPGAAGAFHYVSPLFEQLSGLRQSDLPANFGELLARVHPDDRAAVRAADERAGRTGEPAHVQYRLQGGNGDWVWVDNGAVLMRDDDGRPVAWHGALLDITARVRLEAALRESEMRFRRAFEDAAIGMSLGSPDTICLDANAAYCRIVGRSREELIGLHFEVLTHPDDVETYRRQVARLHAGESDAFEIEQRYLRPDGSIVIGRLTVSAVRDETGDILYDFGQLQDITPYKAASAALREQQDRLRKLVEHLPAALYRQDAPADGSATYVNPSFAALLGLEPNELPLGFPAFFGRVHPDDREAVARAAAHAEHSGEPMDIEYRLQRGDGEWAWVHDRSVLERDPDGRPRSWTGILLDISERKRLEASLRESEAHLRAIVEHVPAAVYRLEPGADGRFTYASPRFSVLTGLSLERRDGHLEAFFTRVHPDDVAAVRTADVASGQTGDNFDVEYRLRSDDGSWIWVQDRSTLLRDEDGRPLAWHGIMLDVTERKRLEASVRESEERFRSIFEDAGIGMATIDSHGAIIDANQAMACFLGYPRDALRRLAIPDITHPDDLTAAVTAARRLATGESQIHAAEKRFVRADGQPVWGDVTLTAVRDADGAVLCLIAQVQDISARKDAETALRDSEARFRALVENDPDVILILSDALRVSFASPSTRDAFGAAPEELLGPIEPALRFIHPADLERALARFDELRGNHGAVASAEARIKHRDQGWRWFLITVANRVDDPGIDGYLFNLRDITDRKHAALALEAALETQLAAIAELERLNQSKSRFLSTISHEFRTPLTAIIGYSEFLTASAGDPTAVAEDAAVIHREASRLNRMVDDVLLLDRADAGRLPLQRQPLQLNDIVQDVVAAFRPLTEGHRIVLSLARDLALVDGDRDRLLQAMTNLVSNAVKYAPGGGRITIATRNDGDYVLLSVQDQGIGIAAADLPRIFDRFERIESGIAGRISGAGLGLPIVREITALHGGRVWAESEPGIGSTFSLALPAARG